MRAWLPHGRLLTRCVAIVLVVAAVSAGCGGSSIAARANTNTRGALSASSPLIVATTVPFGDPSDTEPSATFPGAVTYTSVEELRDHLVGAGGQCSDFTAYAIVGAELGAGSCNRGNTVLSVFKTQPARDHIVDGLRQSQAESKLGNVVLVGPNWIINSDRETIEKVGPALGGTAYYSEYQPSKPHDSEQWTMALGIAIVIVLPLLVLAIFLVVARSTSKAKGPRPPPPPYVG
jgi:hypothetical protein